MLLGDIISALVAARASGVFNNGPNFSDPREFYRAQIAAAAIENFTEPLVSANAATSGFFTQMGTLGLADNTAWTANTFKTLLSISSGIGYVAGMIGPTGLAGTPTTTFEITVDGVLTNVAVTATTTGQRAVIGAVATASASGATFTTAKAAFGGVNAINAGKDTQVGTASGEYEIMPWMFLRMVGTPCLVFRQSLLIRAKSSESNSTSTNQEQQSAVQYMVMA